MEEASAISGESAPSPGLVSSALVPPGRNWYATKAVGMSCAARSNPGAAQPGRKGTVRAIANTVMGLEYFNEREGMITSPLVEIKIRRLPFVIK